VWWLAPGDLALLAGVGAVALVGAWAAGREEQRVGEKDPGAIVVDEVAGMLLACSGLPRGLVWVLAAFLAFRVLDVWKPLGIRRLQALPGGVGVVVDDLVAGAYVSLLGQLRHVW
jgi:phosphatidylglycerophosphatase A